MNKGRVLTAGTRSFFTSSTALLILISARACVSSTVMRTCRSSFRCSQFGFPRFCSSWNEGEEVSRKARRACGMQHDSKLQSWCVNQHMFESDVNQWEQSVWQGKYDKRDIFLCWLAVRIVFSSRMKRASLSFLSDRTQALSQWTVQLESMRLTLISTAPIYS